MNGHHDQLLFADPKSDLAFKKAFGTREGKGSLIALLNALLRLPDAARIVDLEYLSPEQLPAHDGLKLSILDVKCMDAQGARYVVEMQVFPVEGFEKRVVFNACKAYVEQLDQGQGYSHLSDVVAVTICNFALWPEQVGMLSRWSVKEDETGTAGLQQIQYVFLELSKYPANRRPVTMVEKWACFFREAARLHEIPEELREAPFLAAFEAVKRVNFSNDEWTLYQREKIAEEDFHGGLSYARKQGFREGQEQGESNGLRRAILSLCEVLDISLGPAEQAQLAALDLPGLQTLCDAIKAGRRWPSR